MSHRLVLPCAAALALVASTARAQLVIDFAEVGNDVVATGSGTANLAGLTFAFNLPVSQVNLDAGSGNYRGGAAGVPFVVYSGLSGPGNFGPGNSINNVPSSSSGDYFGLTAFNGRLFLPDGYASGTQLSHTASWANRTFASLGLGPAGSTYTYTWGSGANADSLTIRLAAVPEPTPLLLAFASLGLAAFRGVRRGRLFMT